MSKLQKLYGFRCAVYRCSDVDPLLAEKEAQLSASNAACAEMREALESACKLIENNTVGISHSVNFKRLRDLLAAQPKQQEQQSE